VILNGLINYWPINADLKDYIGSSDMSPGTDLETNGSVGFGADRFSDPSGAIYLNNGYYTVPPGVYFSGDFTILAWVKEVSYMEGSRLIDFGNGPNSDNVIAAICDVHSEMPRPRIFVGANYNNASDHFPSAVIKLNEWYHLAYVLNGTNMTMYINGENVGSQDSMIPAYIVRSSSFIGRSNWYPGDQDANAYFDEIKIYNRALSPDEVAYDMTVSSL